MRNRKHLEREERPNETEETRREPPAPGRGKRRDPSHPTPPVTPRPDEYAHIP